MMGRCAALPPKSDRTIRVAFLGTSQTWGSGAERISETFVARCHGLLAQALGDISVETYNFSISGSNSTELLGKYAESWRFSQPDLLVINLSTNDRKSRYFDRESAHPGASDSSCRRSGRVPPRAQCRRS